MHSHSDQAEIQRIGQALQQAEKNRNVDAQIRLYRKLRRITPNVPLVAAQLAHLLFQQGVDDEAHQHAIDALAQAPQVKVDSMLFPHFYVRERYKTNLTQAKEWYLKEPNLLRFKLYHQALTYAGSSHADMEAMLHGALERFTQADEQSQVLSLLGQAYYAQGRFHDTIACYQLGLQMTPKHRSQLLNMAVALEQVGRYSESLEYYKQLLAMEPDHAGVHNNIAITLLKLGQFEAGWEHYEWRWKAARADLYHQFNIPRWAGEPLQGKTLLVWGEQGIGDHIMFASTLNELQHRVGNPEQLHYEIYARLDTLFQRSFPNVNFIRSEEHGELEIGGKKLFKQSWPRSDLQIPAGSLMGIFRPSLESFPKQASFLKADPEQTQAVRSQYQSLFPGKRLIGVSWRGGRTVNTEMQTRLVGFEALQQLAACTGVQLIDLQYDSTPEELARAAELGVPMFHDDNVDARLDMDPQASQISALDAVISIDNTTIHLAGALGVPTYVLVPLNPNWRWGLEEGQSHWYPSVQVFRNRALGDWREPVARVITALESDGLIPNQAHSQGGLA
ncbi:MULTISPECIES: tetratricopeptide repeat-containing glycosyltransferase family protein [Pseudomonas]|uniref:tetratricopeptide repeat-containing glycosyltransferase family protein n=1 Tax=Pseudomonas TaxID=286 RepID=UPI0021F8D17E|nr:tetratricopeptide repeat-containing glycosyltransferase family protein [Pseudomonas putida]